VVEAQETEQEPESVEVAIEEADQPETDEAAEPDPATTEEVATEGQEQDQTADLLNQINELIASANLPDDAKQILELGTYADLDALQVTIDRMSKLLSNSANAGTPFALGESTTTKDREIPQPLTPAELEQRSRERFNTIMSEVSPTYRG